MADASNIEWTDATWNPITGCSIVSPGCTNCYAMRLAGGRLRNHPSRQGLTKPSKAGPVWTGEVRFNEQWLTQPLLWREPRMIFVCAHGDLFHENVPNDWIDAVFAVMALCPQHTFQVLTKRAARMRAYCDTSKARAMFGGEPISTYEQIYNEMGRLGENGAVERHPYRRVYPNGMPWPLPNVWVGTSAERQKEADERIPDLLATPAAVRFASLEPLLGGIDLVRPVYHDAVGISMRGYIRDRDEPDDYKFHTPKLDWVIVGGESGPGARPMHPDWARSIRDQCQPAGVAYFFKQWGAWAPATVLEANHYVRRNDGAHGKLGPHLYGDHLAAIRKVGKKAGGRLLDGREWNEMPRAAAPAAPALAEAAS